MHYLDEGEGRAVLMVHGNPTWSFFYRRLVAAMSGGRRCVVPDHLGCGLSDKPQDYPYRLSDHIGNLEHLVDHLNLDRFDLIVHDWGGPIGLAVAEKMADRVGRLVIFNTAAFRSQQMPPSIRIARFPVLGSVLIRGCNAFSRGAVRSAVCRPLRAEVAAGFLYPYRNWNDRVAVNGFIKDIPLSPRHPSYDTLLRIEERLPVLAGIPTLIAWGMQDFVFTKHFLEAWAHHIPNAQVHRFESAGHYLLEDAGDEILPLVKDFLDKDQN
jgi:pimeloyl-ACP methyl ester carboxylesterase